MFSIISRLFTSLLGDRTSTGPRSEDTNALERHGHECATSNASRKRNNVRKNDSKIRSSGSKNVTVSPSKMRREDRVWSRQQCNKASIMERAELQRAIQNGEPLKVIYLAAKGRPRKHLQNAILNAKEGAIIQRDIMQGPSLLFGGHPQESKTTHLSEASRVGTHDSALCYAQPDRSKPLASRSNNSTKKPSAKLGKPEGDDKGNLADLDSLDLNLSTFAAPSTPTATSPGNLSCSGYESTASSSSASTPLAPVSLSPSSASDRDSVDPGNIDGSHKHSETLRTHVTDTTPTCSSIVQEVATSATFASAVAQIEKSSASENASTVGTRDVTWINVSHSHLEPPTVHVQNDAQITQYPGSTLENMEMTDVEETTTVETIVPATQMPQAVADNVWTLLLKAHSAGYDGTHGEMGVPEGAQILQAELQCDEGEPMDICYLEDSWLRVVNDFGDLSTPASGDYDCDMLPPNAIETADAIGTVKDYSEALDIGIVPFTKQREELVDVDMADGTGRIEGSEEPASIPAVSSDQLNISGSVDESAVSTTVDCGSGNKEEEPPVACGLPSPPATETRQLPIVQNPQASPLDLEAEAPSSEQGNPQEESLLSTPQVTQEEESSVASNKEEVDSNQRQRNHVGAKRPSGQDRKQAKNKKHKEFRARLKKAALWLEKCRLNGKNDSNVASQMTRLAETGWGHLQPREVVSLLPSRLRMSL